MPPTHRSEAALELRRQKQAFVRAFPGLLGKWEETEGKSIQAVLDTLPVPMVLFTDGSFILTRPTEFTNDELLLALLNAREPLSQFHAEAVAELEQWVEGEMNAMRLARLEKILGAVETNMPDIPELRDELLSLLERLD